MEYGKKVRMGGFNLLKYKKNEMSFIKVSTIMGSWSMEWREDALMYHVLDSELSEDELRSLNVLVVNAFMVGSFVDAEFQHAVMTAAGEFQERVNASAPAVSDEEDAEILSRMRTEAEIVEELVKSADGEEGGKAEGAV